MPKYIKQTYVFKMKTKLYCSTLNSTDHFLACLDPVLIKTQKMISFPTNYSKAVPLLHFFFEFASVF